jgi:hypothetical protein
LCDRRSRPRGGGTTEPWLAGARDGDKIIRLGPNSDLAARVREAEKFSFDAATTTRVCIGLRDAPPSMVEAAIPDLAVLPYCKCWFEWHLTTPDDPGLFLTEGLLVDADETLQRDQIWHIGETSTARKSIGAENTFPTDLFTYEAARDALREIVNKVWEYCEGSGLRGRTVTLKVKFANFQQIMRSRTGQTQIRTRSELEQLGKALLEPSFQSRKASGSSVSHYLHSWWKVSAVLLSALGSNRLDPARAEMSGCGAEGRAVVSIKRALWSPDSPRYCRVGRNRRLTRSRFVFDKSAGGTPQSPRRAAGINPVPALGGAMKQVDLRDRGQGLG